MFPMRAGHAMTFAVMLDGVFLGLGLYACGIRGFWLLGGGRLCRRVGLFRSIRLYGIIGLFCRVGSAICLGAGICLDRIILGGILSRAFVGGIGLVCRG